MNPTPAHRPNLLLRPVLIAMAFALSPGAWAADPATSHGPAHAAPTAPAASAPAKAASQEGDDTSKKIAPVDSLPTRSGNAMAEKIRAAMAGTVVASKKMTVVVEDKEAEVQERVRARKEGGASWNVDEPHHFVCVAAACYSLTF